MRSRSRAVVLVAALMPALAAGWRRPVRAQASEPGLRDVLASAASYLDDYAHRFSAVLSEERYQQTVTLFTSTAGAHLSQYRDLRSDVILMNLGRSGWSEFRDVYQVDGKPVRDHDARLQQLFAQPAADVMARAHQIADESASHNIGAIRRNINVPTMALTFLLTGDQSRSTFAVKGTDTIRGVRVVVVEFKEQATPRVIGSSAGDAPAHGRFWIDQATGRVVRTELRLEPGTISASVIVNYAPQPALDLWVPVSMDERYHTVTRDETDTGHATYSHFQKFSVATSIKRS
jgi:hypothetical protein